MRDPIVMQLTQGITPEKISLTLAIGSACALFPLFGVTSLLCFGAALIWRLNQPIIQVLNQLLLPVHVGTWLGLIRMGEILFQVPSDNRLVFNFTKIHERYFAGFWSHPISALTDYVKDNTDSVVYSIVAWAICVPLYVPVVYFAVLPLMRGIVKVKAEVAAKKIAAAPPSDSPVP